ncbi:O-methyltransferase [Chryseobacterium sp. CP-77]|uniref:O-methyltransferase n=1 Tax=Chryseobacterium sp. CP-77 TaxID=3116594 RepID=UPI002ED429EC
MSTVLKTFVAYLKRPPLYPELGRKIIKNTFNRRSPSKGKARANFWAASIAVSQEEVISRLFSRNADHFGSAYADILQKASVKERECPVKMGEHGALELIYYACEFTKAQNVLETGVAYGWSSLAILLSLQKRNGTLYSSDMPFLAQNGDQYAGYVVPDHLKKYWKLFRFADRESLPKIFKQATSFDVFHYDSDKSYHGRMWAYHQIYKKLRPGGVFISDDIGDNSAYQDFCNRMNISTCVVEYNGKYIGIFVKEYIPLIRAK